MFPYLQTDKLAHGFVGVLIFLVVANLIKAVAPGVAMVGGAVMAAVVGISWEFWQRKTGSGMFEQWDMIFTAAGGLVGYLCAWSL